MGGPIQLGGLASGLDTTSLIAQLMQLESRPLIMLQAKQRVLDSANTDFQLINSKVNALMSAAKDLTLDLNLKAKAAVSSDPTTVTALAGSGAAVGSYQIRVDQLATASTVQSGSALGVPITSTTAALSSLNFSSPFTSGGFTIQTTSTTGVTTNYKLNLASTATMTDVINAVNSVSGLTASLGADNKLHITAANTVQAVTLGASGDTSNILGITNLAGQSFANAPGVGGGTLNSTYGMGVTQVGAIIGGTNASQLKTAITTNGAGSFTINGVAISYNTTTDSINSILGKINSSAAGVTATYNSVDDKVTITSRTTGSSAISMSDTTGNFLGAVGLVGGSQKILNGQNALIGIVGVNGFTASTVGTASDVSSATNTFANVVPGLTLTAVKTNAALQTVTVSPDNTAITGKVKAFVDSYNTTIDAINAATAKGATNAFDGDLTGIKNRLQSLVSSIVPGLASTGPRALPDLGISTTYADREHLTFDTTKFTNALNANPDQVAAVFSSVQPNPSKPGTTINMGIAGQMSDYLFKVGGATGVFATRNASVQQQDRAFGQQILNLQGRLDQSRLTLVKQFAAMEAAVSKIHSQQSAFLSQLGSLGH